MSDGHTEQAHVVGYGSYILIWLSLLAFSGMTVAIAGFDLGIWTVVLAVAIAMTKATLVLSVFMHLKFEQRVFRIFLAVALLTLLTFFVLTFFDYANM